MRLRSFRHWNFSSKVVFAVLMTTSLMVTAALGALLVNDMVVFRQHQQRKLSTLAKIIAYNTQAALAFGDASSAETTLEALKAEKHIVNAAIYTGQGQLFASYRPIHSQATVSRYMHARDDVISQPITLDGKTLGMLYLRADRGELADILQHYFWMAAMIFLAAIIGAAVLAYKMQNKITEPILRLTELAKKVSREKDYSLRAVRDTEDELGTLIENFNGMLQEIQTRERTLSNQWRWLQNVLDLMPTPFMLIESGNGKITFANKAALDISGGRMPDRRPDRAYRQGELFSVYESATGRLLSPAETPSMRLARGEKVDGAIIDWLTPAGIRTLIVYGDLVPSLHGHSSVGALTFHDITHLKRTERELKQIASQLSNSNLELAQSNKDLEQFTYIASHDLQEPLRKIINYSERLQERISGSVERDYFDRMRNAGFRMRKVIEDLLQYSRISKHEEMPIEDIDLKALIQEVLEDIEVKLIESQARVRVSSCELLKGNRSQLKHLFQNLITNSIKFARKDVTPEIDISCRPLGDEIELRVSDNGIGFDEKYLDKIFKPFQRLHGRDEYEGTGIGLSIVHKIVQNHGGRITAQSKLGQGAVFILTLPTRQARGL